MRPVTVLIEVARGSFVKREAGLGVEFLSPIPCPFNYGCVPGAVAEDGDPPDAIVLGSRIPHGTQVRTNAWLRMRFLDDGANDDKLICGEVPPTQAQLAQVERFFRVYAVARTAMNLARRRGPARAMGIAPLLGEDV